MMSMILIKTLKSFLKFLNSLHHRTTWILQPKIKMKSFKWNIQLMAFMNLQNWTFMIYLNVNNIELENIPVIIEIIVNYPSVTNGEVEDHRSSPAETTHLNLDKTPENRVNQLKVTIKRLIGQFILN